MPCIAELVGKSLMVVGVSLALTCLHHAVSTKVCQLAGIDCMQCLTHYHSLICLRQNQKSLDVLFIQRTKLNSFTDLFSIMASLSMLGLSLLRQQPEFRRLS